MWSSQQLWVNSPRWDFMRAAGSLGWAFPASIGAKCAAPDRPVICFTGDGGFWYHLQELETAVRCNIPTITCVNNNNSLNQETSIFQSAYDGHPSAKQGEMWHFSPVNFAKSCRDSRRGRHPRRKAPGPAPGLRPRPQLRQARGHRHGQRHQSASPHRLELIAPGSGGRSVRPSFFLDFCYLGKPENTTDHPRNYLRACRFGDAGGPMVIRASCLCSCRCGRVCLRLPSRASDPKDPSCVHAIVSQSPGFSVPTV